MSGYNHITLMGNLGGDPELRVLQSGKAMLRFSLAVSKQYLDDHGTKHEQTDWFSCVAWGKQAEGLAKHLRKGMRVFVDGEMRSNTQEKEGEKRTYWSVQINKLVFAERKPKEQSMEEAIAGSPGPGAPLPATTHRDTLRRPAPAAQQRNLGDVFDDGVSDSFSDDDIPF